MQGGCPLPGQGEQGCVVGEAATALSPQTQHGDIIWATSRGQDEKPSRTLGPLLVMMDQVPSVSSPGLDLGQRSPSGAFVVVGAGVATGLAFGSTGNGAGSGPCPDPRLIEGRAG